MATPYSALILSSRRHLNEIYTLVRPNAPLVSAQGVTGATAHTYLVVARNSTGTSEASPTTAITNGNATLTGSNFNQLTWTAVPYADSYDVYRTVGGATQGKIVSATTALTANDTGLAGDSTTAATVNTSGVTNAFWTDDELLDYGKRGTTDLWAAILDVHQEHYRTIDETNVSMAANTGTLTGVPADTFRVLLIEPRDTSNSNASRNIRFVPRKYNHADFINARAEQAVDPSNGSVIYYAISGAGSPVAAPTVEVAPRLSSALLLRFVYAPTLGISSYTVNSNNPIPGEADNAIIAWIVAFARGKERPDKAPDPGWLSIYATEKQSLLTRITPRQEQEPEVVDGLFEGYW